MKQFTSVVKRIKEPGGIFPFTERCWQIVASTCDHVKQSFRKNTVVLYQTFHVFS